MRKYPFKAQVICSTLVFFIVLFIGCSTMPAPVPENTGSIAREFSQSAYLKASNADVADHFGHSVAIDGNTMVVGAPNENSDPRIGPGDNSVIGCGAAYVFVRGEKGWVQQEFLKASDGKAGDHFGWSVAIYGNTIIVGAPHNSGGSVIRPEGAEESGAAYVFARSGTEWAQTARLKATKPLFADWFGYAVGISGDTVVVGAPDEFLYGEAYVFSKRGAEWAQSGVLDPGPYTTDQFGFSVGISNGIIAIGAPAERASVYIFKWSGGLWILEQNIKKILVDGFGASLAIHDGTIVIGAPGGSNPENTKNSVDAIWCGVAYVFCEGIRGWEQQAFLSPSNGDSSDQFGYSVAILGDTIAIGARYESSRPKEGFSENDYTWSGAAYIFTRSEKTWKESKILKASNAERSDQFGFSISISDDFVAVGAEQENGTSSGGPNDNGASWSGAAYIFE